MNNETKILSEIERIKERNKRVELDKAWETSTARKVSIAVITYLFMTIFFYSIDVDKPHINSLVPTFGYLLSTLTIGILKKYWIKTKSNGRS